MSKTTNTTWARTSKVAVLIVLILVMIGMKAPVTNAVVGVPISTLTDVFTIAQNKKDFILNQLAFLAAKQVLHQMAASTIDWINSGFNGKPAFISNPEAFFVDVADQTSGAFLAKNGATEQLCSPWTTDIRLVLSLERALTDVNGFYSKRYTCTLGTIIDNAKNASVNGYSIRGFVNGDFKQGGWPAFIAFTTESQNNPAGAYLQAKSDMLSIIGVKENAIKIDLLQGRGFLSKKKCTKNSAGEDICEVVTPGSTIADTLENATGVPFRELELAQDINAVLSALVSQMINQMLTKGLATLSGGGSGVGGGSGGVASAYTSQVSYDARSAKTVPTSTSGGPIDVRALEAIEKSYRDGLNSVTDSRTRLDTAKACYSLYVSTGGAQSGFASGQIAVIDSLIASELIPLSSTLNSKLITATNRVAGAGASTAEVTLPASSNSIETAEELINAQIKAYETSIDSELASGLDLNAEASKAAADLEAAMTKVVLWNSQAMSFQSTCEGL